MSDESNRIPSTGGGMVRSPSSAEFPLNIVMARYRDFADGGSGVCRSVMTSDTVAPYSIGLSPRRTLLRFKGEDRYY
jgi:hypothetical protein